MSKKVSFKVTKDERLLVLQAAKRAQRMMDLNADQTTDIAMDLCACHANGNPLDFEKLVRFDDFSFAHDIAGIARHINRDTGKLERNFLPRCSIY